RRSIAKLNVVTSLQSKRVGAHRAVLRARAANDDVFPILDPTAVQCLLETGIGVRVDETNAILKQAFSVGAGFVAITLLITICRVRRDRDMGLSARRWL